jgi:uncharacterized BrkB/YihY/UPF0761 family membrane protein
MNGFRDRLKAFYGKANDLSGGSLDILRNANKRFNDARASEAAAGMAYYAVFSLFPLLLALWWLLVVSFWKGSRPINKQ